MDCELAQYWKVRPFIDVLNDYAPKEYTREADRWQVSRLPPLSLSVDPFAQVLAHLDEGQPLRSHCDRGSRLGITAGVCVIVPPLTLADSPHC